MTARQLVLTPLDPADYSAIEAAVLETARGRWFLAEYARRNRNADTEALLGAIGRLEEIMSGERAAQEIDRLRFDLIEMAKVISRTKAEVAAMRPDGSSMAADDAPPETLDGIARTAERATAEILDCAETIQEAAWTLREQGSDADQCSTIDHRATQIYAACSFQDLTAKRTTRVVHALLNLEGRINAMIDLRAGGHEAGAADAADLSASLPPVEDEVDPSMDLAAEEPAFAPMPAQPASAAGDLHLQPVEEIEPDDAAAVSQRFEQMMAEERLSALVEDNGIADSVFVIEDEADGTPYPAATGALSALQRLQQVASGESQAAAQDRLADDDIAFSDEESAMLVETPLAEVVQLAPALPAHEPAAEDTDEQAEQAAPASEHGTAEADAQMRLPQAMAFPVAVAPMGDPPQQAPVEPADPLAAIDGWDVEERLRRFT